MGIDDARFYVRAIILRVIINVMGFASADPIEDREATGWLERAKSLEPDHAHTHLATFLNDAFKTGRFNADSLSLRRALQLAPTDPFVLNFGGWGYLYSGDTESGLLFFDKARKYGPFDPLRAHAEAGTALCLVLQSRFDEAVRHAKAAIAINNRFPVPYRALAAAEAHRGGTVAAKYALQELLRLVPDDSVSLAQKRGRWMFTPGIEPYFDGLRKAGLPE